MNINDRVKIINDGKQYCGYKTMAKKMKLKNWITDLEVGKKTGTILCLHNHETTGTLLAGIRLDTGEEIIMGVKGLKIIETHYDKLIKCIKKGVWNV